MLRTLALLASLAAPLVLFAPPGATETGSPALPSAQPIQTAQGADEYAPVQTEFPIDCTFEKPLVPYQGFDSLEEFRGRPVLVLCWYLESVDARLRLTEALERVGERLPDIHVLLCETSKLPSADHDRFLWESGLRSTPVHTCREEVVPRQWHAFQAFVLDATGRVHWWGTFEGDFEGALDRTMESAAARAEYTNSKAQKGWTKFDEGDWKAAHRIGQQVRKKGLKAIEDGDGGVSGELDDFTQGELLSLAVEDAILHAVRRAERLLATGQPAAASDLFEQLEDRGVPGVKRCEDAMDNLKAQLKDRDTKKLVTRDRALNEILARAAGNLEDGGELEAERDALRSLIEENAEDPVAERARSLIELIGA